MRRFLLAAVMFGAAAGAQAADMPDFPILRGGFTQAPVAARVIWQGYYIGGQAGYGSSDEDFGRFPSTRPLMQGLLAGTTIETEMGVSSWAVPNSGKLSQRSWGGGAFAGYNSQWDDVVVGVEASYLHGGFGGSLTTADTRSSASPLTDNYYHQVTATSQAAISIKDMATLRVRAGYAYECFLPYLFGGVALGNADISRSVTVRDVTTPGLGNLPALPPVFLSAAVAQHDHLLYGYSAGLGVDVNLIGGLFLRAEWEYLRFTTVTDVNINTVRAGLGYKF
jgi:outer membrane immunogenic protein